VHYLIHPTSQWQDENINFGAGAIGTYIGGSLALAGHQAVFVEQPGVSGGVVNVG
jgi:hypothetical protein